MADDEAELVGSCLAGDPAGLRAFVERFQGMIFGLCFRMLGHREDAEDVVQDVFLRVFRSLGQWDSARDLKPWLLTIAANRCRTLLLSRTQKPKSSEFLDDLAGPDVGAPGSELAEELQRALETVREEYRLCFILYHLHELSLAEISGILGAPTSTIKTWLFRVRRELADALARRGLAPHIHHELY